jgi:hypothetical protein
MITYITIIIDKRQRGAFGRKINYKFLIYNVQYNALGIASKAFSRELFPTP